MKVRNSGIPVSDVRGEEIEITLFTLDGRKKQDRRLADRAQLWVAY